MIDFSKDWSVLFQGEGIDIWDIVSNLDLRGYNVLTVGKQELPVLTVDDSSELLNIDTPTVLVVDLDRTDSYDIKGVVTLALSCRSTKLRLLLFSSHDLTELGQDYVNLYASCSSVI